MCWHSAVMQCRQYRLPSFCTFYYIYWSKSLDAFELYIIHIWEQYRLAVSCARMVDYCWHNVEIKVQQCYVAVKSWFRGSFAVVLKCNELHLELSLNHVVASYFKSPHTLEIAFLPPFSRRFLCSFKHLWRTVSPLLSHLSHNLCWSRTEHSSFSTHWGVR